jgi:hypothetical protein
VRDGITQAQVRMLGRTVMAVAAIEIAGTLVVTRRAHPLLAVPAVLAGTLVAGLALWIGYTMTVTDWDAPADYPPPN